MSLWKDDNLSISLNEERKACPLTTGSFCIISTNLALVVQRLDSAIHRIKLYPMNNAICFAITYPLDSIICSLYNWALVLFVQEGDCSR